ncbi:hypothetical protein J0A68_11390 [Algoriphagus sp. H41]|uniref:Uncharacterized protein n=1 Tax=Algoriphagus oliviformis TaxID=2811231 RepID=A0ABS3C368_9BACT|nr:hypothetical protein [Algoriphagus oliviformis]MBN7811557.1 hypothetical protein [Algoriphagus oliviformis]
MDSVIIIGLVGLFIATIFATVYFLPTMLTSWRASALGLNLTYGQARIITKDFCNKKEFFLTVKDIWELADIPVDKLTSHYNAKGDLRNLRDGIIEMKQQSRDIDFSTLSTFDLAGRNLREEVKKAEMKNWVFDLTTE